jgi:hypothetical protein
LFYSSYNIAGKNNNIYRKCASRLFNQNKPDSDEGITGTKCGNSQSQTADKPTTSHILTFISSERRVKLWDGSFFTALENVVLLMTPAMVEAATNYGVHAQMGMGKFH